MKKQTKEIEEIRQCPECKGKYIYVGTIGMISLLNTKKIPLECATCYHRMIYLPREGKLIDGEKK